jgi:hypothetical protein
MLSKYLEAVLVTRALFAQLNWVRDGSQVA